MPVFMALNHKVARNHRPGEFSEFQMLRSHLLPIIPRLSKDSVFSETAELFYLVSWSTFYHCAIPATWKALARTLTGVGAGGGEKRQEEGSASSQNCPTGNNV